jgi:hypothetical protein
MHLRLALGPVRWDAKTGRWQVRGKRLHVVGRSRSERAKARSARRAKRTKRREVRSAQKFERAKVRSAQAADWRSRTGAAKEREPVRVRTTRVVPARGTTVRGEVITGPVGLCGGRTEDGTPCRRRGRCPAGTHSQKVRT